MRNAGKLHLLPVEEHRLTVSQQRRHVIVLALMLGIVLRLFYFAVTAPGDRDHDFLIHSTYLSSVFDLGKIPSFDTCDRCHHPPLFYY